MNNDQTTAIALGKSQQVQPKANIKMDALIEEWKQSASFVEGYSRDFQSLQNLVDGVPLNPDNSAPFVGDTTLAGLVRSIPRNSLQQLPVYSAQVNGSKNSIAALICTYLLKQYVFNEDTFGKGLLSTLQIGAEQAITVGYSPFVVAIGQMYNDFGAMLKLLHFTDTSPEPGITDHNETGYDFVVAHVTRGRLQRIRNAAARNPDTSWDLDMLDELIATNPEPTNYSQFQSAPQQNKAAEDAGPTYKLISRYGVGSDDTVITFSDVVTARPLRVMENKSKWGYPRVMYCVIDPAALHPFGVSRVRLASPNQNLMNIYYGNIASMLLLNSKPPILKRGRFLKPVQLKQGAVWETLDQNAGADLKTIDNGALQQFVPMAQQFAAQIQNIMGGQTNTVGPGSKGSAFGKTAPGEKRAEQYNDVSTNQITKILENFLRQYALVALDTIFCEQEGRDFIIVDDDTKNAINEVKPGTIGDDNKIAIDWQVFYQAIEQWSVEVDVSITPDEMKDQKRADLQDTLTVLAQMAPELGPDAVGKVRELTDLLLQDTVPLVKSLGSGTPAPPAQQVTAPIPQTISGQPAQ